MAMKERDAVSMSGWLALVLGLGALVGTIYPIVLVARLHPVQPAPYVLAAIGLFIGGIVLLSGCLVIGPNEARVLTFFGRYTGSVKTSGLRWVNPFTSKKEVSLRVRNFESAKIKVNDVDGNPIEIGAIIVWRVVDTAQATFDVENFGALQESEQHDLHVVADGQGGRRGVEADVGAHDATFEVFVDAGRSVVYQAAPFEFGNKIHVAGELVVERLSV